MVTYTYSSGTEAQRERKWLAQGHSADQWQGWDLKPGRPLCVQDLMQNIIM